MVRVSLIEMIPGLEDNPFIQKYQKYLYQLGIRVDPAIYFFLAVILALVIAGVLFIVIPLLTGSLPEKLADVRFSLSLIFPILLFVISLDLLLGYPVFKGLARIEKIEGSLSDALKQMADILKAGGTYEYALREVANSDLGALADEMQKVLRKLEEGENFENSMRVLTENVDSRLVARIVTIIVDSIRSGAGLADILEDISEDVREIHRVTTERKTRTLMQTMFMFAAGSIVAPAIIGMVSAIIVFLIAAAGGTGLVSQAKRIEALFAKDIIILLTQFYLFVEVLASSLMISLMREGSVGKTIIYFPILLFIAFLIFFIVRIFVSLMLLGGI